MCLASCFIPITSKIDDLSFLSSLPYPKEDRSRDLESCYHRNANLKVNPPTNLLSHKSAINDVAGTLPKVYYISYIHLSTDCLFFSSFTNETENMKFIPVFWGFWVKEKKPWKLIMSFILNIYIAAHLLSKSGWLPIKS